MAINSVSNSRLPMPSKGSTPTTATTAKSAIRTATVAKDSVVTGATVGGAVVGGGAAAFAGYCLGLAWTWGRENPFISIGTPIVLGILGAEGGGLLGRGLARMFGHKQDA